MRFPVSLLCGLLLIVCGAGAAEEPAASPAPKPNGVHNPAGLILGSQLSPDRTKILFYDRMALSIWDTLTGAMLTALYFEYAGMPGIDRDDVKLVDANLKYLFVFKRSAEVSLLLDIASGKARQVPFRLKALTHTGKGITVDDQGVDLVTGKSVALTDFDRAQPLYDGVHYHYYKANKTYLYNSQTQKTRVLGKGENAPGISLVEAYMPIGGHIAYHPTGSPVIFIQDKNQKELSRFTLLHTPQKSSPLIGRFPAPEIPAVVMIEETTLDRFYQGLQAHQTFMTAYRIPDGEVLYSIPLHRPLTEAQAFFQAFIAERTRSLQAYAAEKNLEAAKNGGSSSSASARGTEAAGLRIGDRHADGVIFYLDPSGQHGLVLSLTESIVAERYPTNPEGITSIDANGLSPWYIPSLDDWASIRATKAQLAPSLKREGGKPLGDNAIFYWTSTAVGYAGNRVANRWGYNPDNNERSEMYIASHLCTTRLIRAF